jgi:hypothetical protein
MEEAVKDLPYNSDTIYRTVETRTDKNTGQVTHQSWGPFHVKPAAKARITTQIRRIQSANRSGYLLGYDYQYEIQEGKIDWKPSP